MTIAEVGGHRERFPDARLSDIVLKLAAEVGELADATLEPYLGGKGVAEDEWADCMIVLYAYAARYGFDPGQAFASKWARVRDST